MWIFKVEFTDSETDQIRTNYRLVSHEMDIKHAWHIVMSQAWQYCENTGKTLKSVEWVDSAKEVIDGTH